MEHQIKRRHVVWITAAIALVASIIVIFDVVAHHRGELHNGALGTPTRAAAEAAGASVNPSAAGANPPARLQ
jgi:hypothetical protein